MLLQQPRASFLLQKLQYIALQGSDLLVGVLIGFPEVGLNVREKFLVTSWTSFVVF